MTHSMFRRRIQHAIGTRAHQPTTPRRPRFRPGVEALEDRTVPALTAALSADPTTAAFGQPITLTATLTSSADSGQDAANLTPGHVVFLDDSTFLGDVALPDTVGTSFQAVLPLKVALTTGTHHLTADYLGLVAIPPPVGTSGGGGPGG